MDAAVQAIVRHHVMDDAWAVFEELYDGDTAMQLALDTALLVEGTPKLVAAWALENVSAVSTADAATASGAQVKRQKDGAEELEFFQGQSPAAANAALWAARSARLRAQASATTSVSANPAPEFRAWGIE